ncbi:unnamed protein product [Auanema sp. JU1783]|nr:unnamed protein product [Auanema sp. JU1783]
MDTGGRDYVKQHMPIIGLGTFQIREESTIYDIVDKAFEVGYRFIDTAQCYGNELVIGTALKKLLPKHGLERKDVFITTKLAPSNQGAKKAADSIEQSLEDLQLDYIDLMIIHWPGVNKMKVHSPENAAYRRESYETLQRYYKQGKLKAIGVSNYELCHMEELLSFASVLPALNQVEYHPHFHQTDLVNFCRDKGIHFQAYSSLGSPSHRTNLFNDDLIKTMAEKYGVDVPTFLLAWATSQGISVLPRTTNLERLEPNFKAKEVNVKQEDINCVLENGKHKKVCWDPSAIT